MTVQIVRRTCLTVATVLFVAVSSADAKPKKVRLLSDSVETPYGSIAVSFCRVFKPGAFRPSLVPNAYRAVWSAVISKPDENRNDTYLEFDAPPEGGWLSVSAYLVAGDEVRARMPPKEWRTGIGKDLLIGASREGTVLVMPDGREVPAVFGPDGDLVYFYWDLGTVRLDENGEIIERNYVWQEKDDYLVSIPFHFPMSEKEWKTVPGATLRIGPYELEFVSKAKTK